MVYLVWGDVYTFENYSLRRVQWYMFLPLQLRPRAKIKGRKTSSINVFIAQSLYWPDRTTRPIPLDSRRVGPSSWLTWPWARRSRIGFHAGVIFFKIGAGVTYTVELILMSSFQKYIHFPILDVQSLTKSPPAVFKGFYTLNFNGFWWNFFWMKGMLGPTFDQNGMILL